MKSSHDSRGQAGLSGLWHGLQAHLETVGAAHTAQHHVVVLAARLPGRRHSPTAAPLGSRSDQVNRSTPQQALLPRLGSMGFATISAPPAPETMTADASAAGRIARASVPGNGLVSREDLGRATWLLLHTTAAQYPENPTRRQQRDMRMFINSLSRTYPCAECSKHFRELIKSDPPATKTGEGFQMWMCRFHNNVNKSIGKPVFNCETVASRWGKLDCGEQDACTIRGR